MTTNEFIAQKPSEADVGLYSWEDNVVKDLESENAAKGQAHDMFSRIFRIRIYEFFLPNIQILCNICLLNFS